jgi:formylglycine-generating enzyme required for sulfatase activity
MSLPFAFLKIVGKGVLNAVGGGFVGDVLVDVLPEVAQDVCAWWKKDRTPEQRRADVEALARAPEAAVRGAVDDIVLELAADRPPETREALSLYLRQVPEALRQSLRRPADPAGCSLPPLRALDEPDDVLPLLPAHLPRFRPGDRPLPGIDWELVELLGTGGFGEVWKAKNPHFDAVPPVALKFCLDPAAKDRLLRHEAAILNQVMRQGRHPGIVALQHSYLSADPPCLEYEFVAGGDLAGLLQDWRGQPPGPDRAARVTKVIADLARIVGFAHRLSPPIVHRDLKPANVLVQQSADGGLTLRVADFGIGGVAAGRALVPTRRDVSRGNFLVTALRGAHTPLYASPQQTRGAPPDPRDDVFSLGVIWYQLLTGNLVAGRPGGTRWAKRLTEQGLSESLVELLGSCVEEEPGDRPADAADLAERIVALSAPVVTALAPAPAPAPATEEVSGERCPDCGGPMQLRRSRQNGSYFLGCTAFPKCRGTRKAPPALKDFVAGGPAVGRQRTLTTSIGMHFAEVPAGAFLMGSLDHEAQRGLDEGPRHAVTITRPFYLGIYPVTQREFMEVMGDNPSRFTAKGGGGPTHPVEQVTWHEAVDFCERLSRMDASELATLGKDVGKRRTYRLPTEAEWEYACRAGSYSAFHFGDSFSSESANFDGNHPYGRTGLGPHLERTTKVGNYPANALGLHDMHGNVWEWCHDWYAQNYYANSPAVDPRGPATGSLRVLRGGCWNNSGHLCRSARRNKYAPDFRNDTIGFRVLLEIG